MLSCYFTHSWLMSNFVYHIIHTAHSHYDHTTCDLTKANVVKNNVDPVHSYWISLEVTLLWLVLNNHHQSSNFQLEGSEHIQRYHPLTVDHPNRCHTLVHHPAEKHWTHCMQIYIWLQGFEIPHWGSLHQMLSLTDRWSTVDWATDNFHLRGTFENMNWRTFEGQGTQLFA